jgi:hypothetical protein
VEKWLKMQEEKFNYIENSVRGWSTCEAVRKQAEFASNEANSGSAEDPTPRKRGHGRGIFFFNIFSLFFLAGV